MKNFNFVKSRNIFFIITAVVIVLGVACFFIRGFNVDTDFAGGTNMQIAIGKTLDAAELDNIKRIIDEDIENVVVSSIQKSGADSTQVIIKMKEIDSAKREEIFTKIAEAYSLDESALLSTTNVGASISSDLRRSAFIATVIAVILMLLYIAIRFKFTSAISAVICLIHDLFIMLFAYSLFQIPMQSTMIAALLTILGYSINATIIIFDRIRENTKNAKKSEFGDIVDSSIKSTFKRSINTTITTLFTIGMVYIFGVDSIKDFALPIIVGITAGLYSSVCLAGNIWYVLDGFFGKLVKKK